MFDANGSELFSNQGSSASADADVGHQNAPQGEGETTRLAAAPPTKLTDLELVSRNFERSRDSYEEWLKEFPNDSFALHHMGMLYEEEQRTVEGQLLAESYYRRAIAANANNVDALASLAYLLSKRIEATHSATHEDAKASAASAAAATAGGDGPAPASSSRVDSLPAVTRQEVVDLYEKALSIVRRPRVLKNYSIFIKKEHPESACAMLRECIRKDQCNASVHLLLAELLPRDAQTYLELAKTNDPDNNLCHSMLGGFYEKRGELQAAMECYKNAIRVDPQHYKQWFQLGRIYEHIFAKSFVKVFPPPRPKTLKTNKEMKPIDIYFDAASTAETVEVVPLEEVNRINGFTSLIEAVACYKKCVAVAKENGKETQIGQVYRRIRAIAKRFPWIRTYPLGETVCDELSQAAQRGSNNSYMYCGVGESMTAPKNSGGDKGGESQQVARGLARQPLLHSSSSQQLFDSEGGVNDSPDTESETDDETDGTDDVSHTTGSDARQRAIKSARRTYAFCTTNPSSSSGVLCIRGHPMVRVSRKPPTYSRLATWSCEECHVSMGRTERCTYGAFYCATCKYDLCYDCSLKPRTTHYYADPSREIGVGGMGKIMRAFNPSIGTYCAVKVLFRAKKDVLRQEVKAMKACRHPNVVTVYKENPWLSTAGNGGGGGGAESLSFAMELMAGSLDDLLLKMGPMHESTVRQWVCDALCALVELKNKRIFHRDIKPANILLSLVQTFTPNQPRFVPHHHTAADDAVPEADEKQQRDVQSGNPPPAVEVAAADKAEDANDANTSHSTPPPPLPSVVEYPPLTRDGCIDYDKAYAQQTQGLCVARRAKLADFGICAEGNVAHARAPSSGASADTDDRSLLGDSRTGSTRHTRFAGTDFYASPESKEGRVNHKSDIYSLGLAWHTLLTGSTAPPQYEVVTTPPSLKPSSSSSAATTIIKFDFAVSEDARRIIARMLDQDSDARPTAADILLFPYFSQLSAARSNHAVSEWRASMKKGGSGAEAPNSAPQSPLSAAPQSPLSAASPAGRIMRILLDSCQGTEDFAHYTTRLEQWRTQSKGGRHDDGSAVSSDNLAGGATVVLGGDGSDSEDARSNTAANSKRTPHSGEADTRRLRVSSSSSSSSSFSSKSWSSSDCSSVTSDASSFRCRSGARTPLYCSSSSSSSSSTDDEGKCNASRLPRKGSKSKRSHQRGLSSSDANNTTASTTNTTMSTTHQNNSTTNIVLQLGPNACDSTSQLPASGGGSGGNEGMALEVDALRRRLEELEKVTGELLKLKENRELLQENRELLQENRELSKENRELSKENRELSKENRKLSEENRKLSEKNRELSEKNR